MGLRPTGLCVTFTNRRKSSGQLCVFLNSSFLNVVCLLSNKCHPFKFHNQEERRKDVFVFKSKVSDTYFILV